MKKSDKDRFITLVYNRYGKKMYSYAVTHWNVSEDAAWDLIYKTIYRVLDTFEKYNFETEEKFASFVFRIFINYLKNHYRDTKTERMVELTDMEKISTNEPRVTDTVEIPSQKMKALNEVLDGMDDWERILLLMRSEGRAYSEIATFIDKPENQLKVYYQRLKEKLTKKLNEG